MSYGNQGGGQYESNTNYFQQRNENQGQQRSYGNNNNYQGNKGYGNRGNFKRQKDQGPIELYKPFLVIGNQNPPQNVSDALQRILPALDGLKYTARVNGFEGIGEVMEQNYQRTEVILPWKGFNDKESKFAFTTERAKGIAKLYHKSYDSMSNGIQAFLGTNVRCVIGHNLNGPVLFAIVWSSDGAETPSELSNDTGNLQHVLQMLFDLKVPVFNLGKPDAEQRILNYLGVNTNEQQTQPQQNFQQGQQPGPVSPGGYQSGPVGQGDGPGQPPATWQ